MDDLISRRDAIDAVKSYFTFSPLEGRQCAKALERVPSAPERKRGEWMRYGEDGFPNEEDTVFWQCDQCLEQYTGRTTRIPNFCPNCGADMRRGNTK